MAKHKQIALQWIPGHCQIIGNKHTDALAEKGAKITQTHIGETCYHSIKLHLKQVFQSVYRYELEIKLPQKPWKQEISKIPDWPRRKAVAEFRLRVGHDCLGARLHRIAIRPDPYCMLCSLLEPMNRNHLGQCTAVFKRTECERYWEARATKKIFKWNPLTTRPKGRPKYRWEDIIQDLGQMKIKNLLTCVQDRANWKDVVEKAKTSN